MVDKKAKSIELKANSDREFFLIHGYTGSPTDFNSLPLKLYKKFKVNVRVIRLKGHGTKVSDLNDLKFEDFLNQVEKELKSDLKKGRKIILCGVSFGAQLAFILASKYSVLGLINVCLPYRLKNGLNIPGLEYLFKFKKFWKKRRSIDEENRRYGTFSYNQMHINGLKIVKKANKEIKSCLNKINCPILTIHSVGDPISSEKWINDVNNNVKSKIKISKIENNKNHNVFFSMNNESTHKEIINFIKKII